MTALVYVALLTKMLDPSLNVAQRNDACYELRGEKAPEVLKAMRQSLADQTVRSCAGINLRQAGAIDELKDALADKDFEVRALAVRELGSFQKAELLPLIAEAARDPQLLVQVNAVEGLSDYTDGSAVPYLLDVARRGGIAGSAALDRALKTSAPGTLEVARELLGHTDVSDRLAAMRALAQIGTAFDLPKLQEIARTEKAMVAAQGRGFGFVPAVSLSRAAETTIEAIRKRL